mmetsp:Transcript_129341/g.241959  ORF Transcript_129341/g.241959 Transcript_129341/m.241959 type:complete len:372 (+) Transcript_129341:2-1117(+)
MGLTLLSVLFTVLLANTCGSRIKARQPYSFDEPPEGDNPLASAQLFTKSGAPAPGDALEGKVVLLYFSAHWCGPCRQFTPALRSFYETVKAEGGNIEIVFVSSDFNEEQFEGYFQGEHGDWLAVAYGSQEHEMLNEYYQVEGIPTLIVVDSNGFAVVPDARGDVATAKSLDSVMSTFAGWQEDVEAANAEEAEAADTEADDAEAADTEDADSEGTSSAESDLLASATLIKKSGMVAPADALEDKLVGIYFSAHWCGPCRHFTPVLRSFYEILKAQGKAFEIVFVSSDSSEDEFEEYFDNFHGDWLAVEYGSPEQQALSKFYQVNAIPTLLIVDNKGTVVVPDARVDVADCSSVRDITATFRHWVKSLGTLK